MKHLISLCSTLAFVVLCATGFAQSPTWSDDIAPIIYENCSGCHHDNGIAPFPLMSHSDVASYAQQVEYAVVERIMPPWPADPNYRHFAHETVLEDSEIQAIVDWIQAGVPYGTAANEPAPPTFGTQGSVLDQVDMTVAIEPYILQSDEDEYRWFVIPTNFTDTMYISKIEVIPGLEEVVHHADISYDLTGQSMLNDLADPFPGFNGSTGGPTYSYYMNAWQPGGNVVTYPDDWGIMVPPGADFVIEIHYGPGGQGLMDSTKMNLQFLQPDDDTRGVQVGWLLNDQAPVLVDGPLIIPPNEISTFHQQLTIFNDLSLISICPHMHMLGNSYKVWAVVPGGDTIPLIDIPHWDFHWQKYYQFREVAHLPAGTILHSEGTYDNTSANHDNPNNPPQTVYRGTTTEDEMFLCYFIYAPYHPGDELIVLDGSPTVDVAEFPALEADANAWPNPTSGTIQVTVPAGTNRLTVFDTQGRLMLQQRVAEATEQVQLDVHDLPNGLYLARATAANSSHTFRFVKE